MKKHTGKCLCGEVTYEVSGEPVTQGNCHCIDCRKNTGAGFATILFFKEEQVVQLSGKTSSFSTMLIVVTVRLNFSVRDVVLLFLEPIQDEKVL